MIVGIFVATRFESIELEKEMGIVSEPEDGPWIYKKTQDHNEIFLVITGVGNENAAKAVDEFLENYHPDMIISMGFAGGLIDELKYGDLVISEVLLSSVLDPKIPLISPIFSKAIKVAEKEGLRFLRVRSLTSPSMLSLSEEKKEKGIFYHADIVQMEDHFLGQAAKERNIPFLSLRVISDPVNVEAHPGQPSGVLYDIFYETLKSIIYPFLEAILSNT